MTDGITEGFEQPSETNIVTIPAPAIAQLIGRLMVVRGLQILKLKNTQQGSKNFGEIEEKLLAEVTFLTGEPIGVKLDKHGQVKEVLDPPMKPFETRKMIVGGWFKSRSTDKMANPGWPGLAGILGTEDIGGGQSMWRLYDYTPEQATQLTNWLKWKRQQDAAKQAAGPQGIATPGPQPAPAAAPVPAPAPQPAPVSAAAGPKPPWEQ